MTFCGCMASCIDKVPQISKPNPGSIFDSQWLALRRGKIRYIRRGDPQSPNTVILIPDPPNTIEHMQDLIRILEKDFQVIVFEAIGFGYSAPSLSYNFSIEQNADAIIELLENLGVDRVILAITCIAGLAALRVANRRPELVGGIVLGQTPSLDEAKKWARRVDFKGILGTPFLGQLVLRLMRNRISDLWYRNALPRQAERRGYIERTINSFKNGARFSLASALQSIQSDTTPLSKLTAEQRAVVLWGSLDRTHGKTDKYAILAMLPNGKIKELEHCAHFPDIEAPDEFAKAIFEVSATA